MPITLNAEAQNEYGTLSGVARAWSISRLLSAVTTRNTLSKENLTKPTQAALVIPPSPKSSRSLFTFGMISLRPVDVSLKIVVTLWKGQRRFRLRRCAQDI
jgi:hypothetical protein